MLSEKPRRRAFRGCGLVHVRVLILFLLLPATIGGLVVVCTGLVRTKLLRVRFHIIRNACIEYVGKYQSCMVSKLRIIWKQTVVRKVVGMNGGA